MDAAPLRPHELPPLDRDDPARHEPVVGIGALCDLSPDRTEEGDPSQHFSVSEFVVLSQSGRLLLHRDRGFTLGAIHSTVHGVLDIPIQWGMTISKIRQTALNTVLPEDGPDGEPPQEDHPWEWLADLAHDRGLRVSAGELRALPYDVVISEEIRRWLRETER